MPSSHTSLPPLASAPRLRETALEDVDLIASSIATTPGSVSLSSPDPVTGVPGSLRSNVESARTPLSSEWDAHTVMMDRSAHHSFPSLPLGPPSSRLAGHHLVRSSTSTSPLPSSSGPGVSHPAGENRTVKRSSAASTTGSIRPRPSAARMAGLVQATTSSTGRSSTATQAQHSRYLITVIPPERLPHDPPHPRSNPACSGYGPPGTFKRGILIPLYPTLGAQLGAIAREYGLPSSGGLVLYLVESSQATASLGLQLANGPRISEEAWQMLWAGIFEEEAVALEHEQRRILIASRSQTGPDDEVFSDDDSPPAQYATAPPVPPIPMPFHRRDLDCSEDDQLPYDRHPAVMGGCAMSDGTEESLSGRSSANNSVDRGLPASHSVVAADGSTTPATSVYKPSASGARTSVVDARRDDPSLPQVFDYRASSSRSPYDPAPSPLVRSFSSASRRLPGTRKARATARSRPSTAMSRRSAPAYPSRRSFGAHGALFDDFESELAPRRVGIGAVVGKVEFDIDTRRPAGKWFEAWVESASLSSLRARPIMSGVLESKLSYQRQDLSGHRDARLFREEDEDLVRSTAPLRLSKRGSSESSRRTSASEAEECLLRNGPAPLFLPSLIGRRNPNEMGRSPLPLSSTRRDFAIDGELVDGGMSRSPAIPRTFERQRLSGQPELLPDLEHDLPDQSISPTMIRLASQSTSTPNITNSSSSDDAPDVAGYARLLDQDDQGHDTTNADDASLSYLVINASPENAADTSVAAKDDKDPLADVFGDDASLWASMKSEHADGHVASQSPMGLGIVDGQGDQIGSGPVPDESFQDVEDSTAVSDVAEVAALIQESRLSSDKREKGWLSSPIQLDAPVARSASPLDTTTPEQPPPPSPIPAILIPPSRTSSRYSKPVTEAPIKQAPPVPSIPVLPTTDEDTEKQASSHRLSTLEMQNNLDSLERALAELSPRALKASPMNRSFTSLAQSMFKSRQSTSSNDVNSPVNTGQGTPLMQGTGRKKSVGEQEGYERVSLLEAVAPITPPANHCTPDLAMPTPGTVHTETMRSTVGSSPSPRTPCSVNEGPADDGIHSPPSVPEIIRSPSAPTVASEEDSPTGLLSAGPRSNFASLRSRAAKGFSRKGSATSDTAATSPTSAPKSPGLGGFFGSKSSSKSTSPNGTGT